MPLSPHETKALARLAEERRAEDPALAAIGESSRTARKERSRKGRGLPPAVERGALVVAIPLVVALTLAPPGWQPALAYALILLAAALLPGLVTHVVEHVERADSSSRRLRDRAPAPGRLRSDHRAARCVRPDVVSR
jgi:hypothetical protein